MIKKHLQSNREILKNDKKYEILEKQNNNSKILCWNFWYIVISNDKNKKIKKYFSKKEFYDREINNYKTVEWSWIIIPNIYDVGLDNNLNMYQIELDNIRKNHDRFESFKKINYKDFWELLYNIHSIKFNNWIAYIHWNLHHSNLFLDENNKLWIFDLASMSRNYIEYDIASFFFHSQYDLNILEKVLNNYKYKKFIDYKKVYYHTVYFMKQNSLHFNKWYFNLSEDFKVSIIKWLKNII